VAKPRAIEGLNAEDPYAEAAARIVEVRAGELLDHASGVLDTNDIEPLHDMRVASRRLRAALEIFSVCFPRKELNAALREVKALADALGERRDRDVTIAALETVSASMAAPDRPGIRTFSESLRVEQAAANKALERFVSPERLATLGERLADLVASAKSSPVTTGAEGGTVVQLPRTDGTSDNGATSSAGEEEA
jgi:CHAD domain-containing protein